MQNLDQPGYKQRVGTIVIAGDVFHGFSVETGLLADMRDNFLILHGKDGAGNIKKWFSGFKVADNPGSNGFL